MGAKVICLKCGDVIQSTHRHDFKACTCFLHSKKRIQDVVEKISSLIELKDADRHVIACAISDEFATGVAVDGGDDYCRMLITRTKYEIRE